MLLSVASTLALQILDETGDGVLVTDGSRPDSPIFYANAAFTHMTGYPAAEVLGRNCRILQGADREQPEITAMREAIVAGRPITVTLRNYRKDGSMFWNEVRLAPLLEPGAPNSSPRYYVGFQHDVTERVSAEVELQRTLRMVEEANTAKLRFLKAMGHEFRTPISIIVGFSDLLIAAAKHGTSEARQTTYLGDIRAAANHLLMLVEDARRYLWINNPTDLKRERALLSDAVKGAAGRVAPILDDLGARLQITTLGQSVVEADLPMLQQALENLIVEMARRTARDSEIEVKLHADEEQAIVELRCPTLVLPTSTISGLAPDDHNILNRGLAGIGVALFVAEQIIRFHDGNLHIQSDAQAGTTLKVTVPQANSI